MLQFNKWQIGTIIGLLLLGAYFSVPNFFPADETPPGFLDTRVTPGLDLQGGSYLNLRVETDDMLADRVRGLRGQIRRVLRAGRDNDPRIGFDRIDVNVQALSASVVVTTPADLERATKRLRDDVSSRIDGGAARDYAVTTDEASRTVTLTMTEDAKRFYIDTAVIDSAEVIRRRIDSLGTTEPLIQRQGQNRLVVQVPGASDGTQLQSVINRTGQLTFHMVDENADPYGPPLPNRLILPNVETGTLLVLEDTPIITGSMVTDASATPNQADGIGWQINFKFDGEGTRNFRRTTSNPENIQRRFAIVLDEQVISAPSIREPIVSGSGRITGSFTATEASELAILIRSGALPAELTTIDQRTVGADLGADSVRAGTIALIIGFVGVVIYIAFTYGRFGLYADAALLANVVLIAGALSLLGATLTLPGIAGIVLTIGMAVDANVLIFERIREEVKNGKAPVAAVEAGFMHARSAIFDANLTTLIAAMIMFLLGAGPVRGFAVTLGLGVFTSVFTAYVLTRALAGGYVLGQRPKTISI